MQEEPDLGTVSIMYQNEKTENNSWNEKSGSQVQLESSWLSRLKDEFNKDYMKNLKAFLQSEYKREKIIYPLGKEYFNALNLTPFDKVKVVIMGQDPYHGPDQAHGLSFSVKKGIVPPPSLKNIYKELKTDLNIETPEHGFLEAWAQQGVLMLNAVLTVENGKPASHQGKGWEQFTDKIISLLNEERENLVFILWGSYAQKKGAVINRKKHLVIESVHPSPLSSHRGFFGSKPFSKANEYLKKQGKTPIDWQIR